MIRSILRYCQKLILLRPGAMGDVRWVIGQIQEQGDPLEGAILFEVTSEKATRFQVHTHSSKDDREIVLMVVVDTFGGLH